MSEPLFARREQAVDALPSTFDAGQQLQAVTQLYVQIRRACSIRYAELRKQYPDVPRETLRLDEELIALNALQAKRRTDMKRASVFLKRTKIVANSAIKL